MTNAAPSEPRLRLLTTASQLFYAEGIHSIGVDRIIADAKVTRATFYRHFPAKEDLVVAYLQQMHVMEKGGIEAAVAGAGSPVEALTAVADFIVRLIRTPGFRGCAFLNAAAEYHNPGHAAHQQIIAHRDWFLGMVTELMAQVDKETAEASARHMIMLRDGAMAAGCLFDPALVSETFLRGVEGLLRVSTADKSTAQP
jgi:AcrR family transcriptional regulator